MCRFILGWSIIFSCYFSQKSVASTCNNMHHYQALANKCFDIQKLDSCIFYNYIVANGSERNHDSITQANAWLNIALCSFLSDKESAGKSALSLAKKYAPCFSKENDRLCNGILFFIRKNYSSALKCFKSYGLQDGNKRLMKLAFLYQLKCGFWAEQPNMKHLLKQYWENLKAKGDTSWYGYAETCFYLAKTYYNTNVYENANLYFEESINAAALAARTRAMGPREPLPIAMPGQSRVARAIRTA